LGVLLFLGTVGAGAVVLSRPGLAAYMTLSRFTLDAGHFPVAIAILLLGAISSTFPARGTGGAFLRWTGLLALAFSAVCGILMLVKVEVLEAVARYAYTGFDLGLALSLTASVAQLTGRLLRRERP